MVETIKMRFVEIIVLFYAKNILKNLPRYYHVLLFVLYLHIHIYFYRKKAIFTHMTVH